MTIARLIAFIAFLASVPCAAQNTTGSDRDAVATQKAEMARIAHFDGVFVGPATTYPLDGKPPFAGNIVQRIGPFLDGAVRLMEGRIYSPQGALRFNGLIVFDYDIDARRHRASLFANGRKIVTEVVLNPRGYHFDIPVPNAKAFRRVNVTLTPTQFLEQVDYHSDGRPPRKEFVMTLERVGASDWPLGRPNPVPEAPR